MTKSIPQKHQGPKPARERARRAPPLEVVVGRLPKAKVGDRVSRVPRGAGFIHNGWIVLDDAAPAAGLAP